MRLMSRRTLGKLVAGGSTALVLGRGEGAPFAEHAVRCSAIPCTTAGAYADGLPRAAPESKGIETHAILDFLSDLKAARLELNSFMLYRDGAVVAEGWWWPYHAGLIHMMHSLTKSVTVGAVGWTLADGQLRLDDKVVSFYPEELPAHVSDNLEAMTVKDLLTMQTGHDHQTSGALWRPIKTSWVAEFYKIPVVYKPGTQFVYTSAASYMLSAIISRTTGMPLYEYLKPRFFAKLGIHEEEWFPGPQDITPGANGLSWHTADSLKLGILYLQGGRWNGEQVLPLGWAEEVHKPHVPGQYGYQWWLGPNKVFFADGMFGQYSFVWPEEQAVLACTSAAAEQDDEKYWAIVFKHFPSAFGRRRAPARDSQASLLAATSTLTLLPPLRPTSSPLSTRISGRTYECEPNEDGIAQIRLDFRDALCVFNLRDARGDHQVHCGLSDYVESFTTITGDKLHHEYQPSLMRVVGGAAWKERNALELVWQFTESAFRDTILCRFDGNLLTFDRRTNVNSGPLSRPTVRGRARAVAA
jgi:hypothetical protein